MIRNLFIQITLFLAFSAAVNIVSAGQISVINPSAGSEMDNGENSPSGVLSLDECGWVDPYLRGIPLGEKTGQSVDFTARNGADLCES